MLSFLSKAVFLVAFDVKIKNGFPIPMHVVSNLRNPLYRGSSVKINVFIF